MTTSTKICAIASAVAASSGRLSATMPPKALTGSQASALSQASRRLAADRGAARVGVLDDRDGRRGEFGDQLEGGVGVGVVVVGQLLALELARGRDAGARCRRCGRSAAALVRVLAVAGRLRRASRRRPASRERSTPSSRANHSGDRGVIGGGQRIGLARQSAAASRAGRPRPGSRSRRARCRNRPGR